MKIIGQLVCGPNEKYLEETLQEFQRLCDDAVVATCNATEKEKILIKKYGYWQYEDNREWGRDQPLIKTKLVSKIVGMGADWILALDADETVPSVDRKELEHLAFKRNSCQFLVVNLWNDRKHYIRTGPAAPFWNVRFYRAAFGAGQPFIKKSLHCGNAPQICYTQPAKQSYVPHILLHKGLMLPKSREKKVERYRVYDPHARHKGFQYYDFLQREGTGTDYSQDELVKKAFLECKRIGAIWTIPLEN